MTIDYEDKHAKFSIAQQNNHSPEMYKPEIYKLRR